MASVQITEYTEHMKWMDRLALFAPIDFAGVALLISAWVLIGLRIENPGRRPSVSVLMAEYRREWMRQLVGRSPRIFDAQVMSNLRHSTSFFASASLIALGGGFAAIGNGDRLVSVTNEITLVRTPAIVWEIKLLLTMIFITNAFLKFVWSNRLFGYCSVLMASVPNEADDPHAFPRAAKAAEINISAARAFNRGLRSVYFGLCSTAWLLGALPLLGATVFTIMVLWRREFASKSRSTLLMDSDGMPPPTRM